MEENTDGTNMLMKEAEQLFRRYGVKSVTMDDISRHLGISKKTLYQFVQNKADLIQQIIHQHIKEEKETLEHIRLTSTDAIEEMLQIARYVIRLLKDLSPTVVYDLQKYYRESWELLQSLHQQYIYTVIRDNIERGIKQGWYRPSVNPDIIAKLYVGKTSLVVDEELFPPGDYNKEHLFREYIKYHIHGIASSSGLQLFEQYSKNEL